MFPQEVLDAFTAETGIKVNYSSFDTDETMLAKLETAKGGDYDVVIADDYIIETAIAEGLVMELDKSKIANIGNVNPVYQGQFFDPEDAYTVPYGAGVQTIVYNPDLVDIEISGYAGPVGRRAGKQPGHHQQLPRDERHGAEDRWVKATTPRTWPPSRPRAQSCLSWPPTSASSRTTTCRMT